MASTTKCVKLEPAAASAAPLLLQVPSFPAMHAVILPFPVQGHIIPAFHLAEMLCCQGWTVTFVYSELLMARHCFGSNPGIRLKGLPENVRNAEQEVDRGSEDVHVFFTLVHALVPTLEQTLSELILDSRSEQNHCALPPRRLCIISDIYLSWTQDTACKFNIPRYVLFTYSSACLAICMYLPCLLEAGVVPVAESSSTESVMVPGLPLLHGSDLPWDWQQDTPREWRDYIFSHILRIHESSGILINSLCEVEGELLAAVREQAYNPNSVPIFSIGPILPAKCIFTTANVSVNNPESTHDEIFRWLDAQSPSSVLYIAFGSVYTPSIRQIREIAKALDASDQQAFLWILRLPPSATEASAFPQGFLSRTKSRGLIISTWAPQLRILCHPSVGGFMSHCGWNSILESICLGGVPILALPQYVDQYLNSKMLTEQLKLGVGVQRAPEDAVAESSSLETGMKNLMMQGEEGGEMRRRAKQVKEAAARAFEKGGSSHVNLHDFMEAASSFRSAPSPSRCRLICAFRYA